MTTGVMRNRRTIIIALGGFCLVLSGYLIRVVVAHEFHDDACSVIAMSVANRLERGESVSDAELKTEIAVLIRASVIHGRVNSDGNPTDLNGNSFLIHQTADRVSVSTRCSVLQPKRSHAEIEIKRHIKIKPPPKELVARIRSLRDFNDYAAPDPIVSLEEFFVGNEDTGSMGCNLTDHPGMATFYEELKTVRQRPDVQGVFVAIHELDEDTVWPFSECVYVLTSAPAAEVSKWVQKLQPSEVSDGWLYKMPPNAPQLKDGMRAVSCWWD
jgi:hypothetical protein